MNRTQMFKGKRLAKKKNHKKTMPLIDLMDLLKNKMKNLIKDQIPKINIEKFYVLFVFHLCEFSI